MSLIDLLQGDPAEELGFDPDELKARYLAERDKRIRIDGNEQYTEVVDEFARYDDDPYTERIERDPVIDPIGGGVDVIVVGGGFGGLLMGGRLKEAGFADVRVAGRPATTSSAATASRSATAGPTACGPSTASPPTVFPTASSSASPRPR